MQLLGQYLESSSAIGQLNSNSNTTNNNISIPSSIIDKDIVNELLLDIELIKQELEKLQKKK